MHSHSFVSVCSRCCRRLLKGEAAYHSSVHNYKLVEVGKMESPQVNGFYPAGQFFLHRVFGYRGVLLFPWMARVYNRDLYEVHDSSSSSLYEKDETDIGMFEEGVQYEHVKNLKPETKPYYQALIDKRDIPYVRTHPEAITFLADQNDSSLYSLPGLDYVSHDDVTPYSNTSMDPFVHELFGQFLVPSGEPEGPPFVAREVLNLWREKNHQRLELSEVHCETTEGVRVTVMPFYMGWRLAGGGGQGKVHWWRYNIRIESSVREQLQLKERYWRICSLSGTLETVRGKGVIGQEPLFNATLPVFQYSSHVSLHSPTGHMWGTFRMDRSDNTSFDVRVPPFCLESHDSKS